MTVFGLVVGGSNLLQFRRKPGQVNESNRGVSQMQSGHCGQVRGTGVVQVGHVEQVGHGAGVGHGIAGEQVVVRMG